jgi:hypothetical protein
MEHRIRHNYMPATSLPLAQFLVTALYNSISMARQTT